MKPFVFKDGDRPELVKICRLIDEGTIPGRGMTFAYSNPSLINVEHCTDQYLHDVIKECGKYKAEPNGLYQQYRNAVRTICGMELQRREMI